LWKVDSQIGHGRVFGLRITAIGIVLDGCRVNWRRQAKYMLLEMSGLAKRRFHCQTQRPFAASSRCLRAAQFQGDWNPLRMCAVSQIAASELDERTAFITGTSAKPSKS
jgi:hypothetical protein